MPDDVRRCWIARHPILTLIAAGLTLWQAHRWGVEHAGEDYEPRLSEMREAVTRCNAERQADREEMARQAARQMAASQHALAVAEDKARTNKTLVKYRTKIVRVATDDTIAAGGGCRLPDDWMRAANALSGRASGGSD